MTGPIARARWVSAAGMRKRNATRFRPQSSERGRDARRCQDAARHPFVHSSFIGPPPSFASRSRSFGRSGEGITPCIHWAARTLRREVPEREEDRVVAALLAGGDGRLSLDALGLNKYLCPPLPPPATTCLSSCTASPISEAGFERASASFWRIAAAPKLLESTRIRDCEDAIGAAIRDYLGLDSGDQVFLTASGTDGMLLAACLLALEGRDRPMTVIMPSPSETGSGVPLAAACRVFDGPDAGVSLVEACVTSDHVALRGPDGTPREAGAVAEDFGDAIRLVRGRPVVVFTYGTKTGLVAPVEVPAGVDVIVDACQLRLPASQDPRVPEDGLAGRDHRVEVSGRARLLRSCARAISSVFQKATHSRWQSMRLGRRLSRRWWPGWVCKAHRCNRSSAPLVGWFGDGRRFGDVPRARRGEC